MKTIIENPNEQLIGPVTCRFCRCKFKYTKDEVKMSILNDGWDTEVYYYVSCPNCGSDVNI